jgi:hypothetical protein
MQNVSTMRSLELPDGVVVMIDPGTETKKKNRKRHVKDGAPKSMRGIPHERRSEWPNLKKATLYE